MSELEGPRQTTAQLQFRAVLVLAMSAALAGTAWALHFNTRQILSVTIFTVTVLATLFFWRFRLAIAFLGISALLACKVLTVHEFVESCELPVIIFLVGMMIVVGVLKELGLFTWMIQSVVGMKKMSGMAFTLIIVVLSALMACVVDEVTSIVFVCALIFQVCDTLKVRPMPFLIIAVMSTNIGSSGTMLGNPVGLLIGHNAQLTFLHFVTWAFPVMLLALATSMVLLLLWYRKDIALLSKRLEERRQMGLRMAPLVRVPYKRSLLILVSLITLIALHHPLEKWVLHLESNTILMAAPLVVAGILMIWRHERARHYVEENVEWWTLLFFMMLFAKAGTLEHTGVTSEIAKGFSALLKDADWLLTPVIIFVSAIGSAFVDNVVFVAAFIPVVKELGAGVGAPHPLWWALLFGACFGGNITMIGSTANLVALGMLEKRYRVRANFLEWLKVGLLTGLAACLVAWVCLIFLGPLMTGGAPIPVSP